MSTESEICLGINALSDAQVKMILTACVITYIFE